MCEHPREQRQRGECTVAVIHNFKVAKSLQARTPHFNSLLLFCYLYLVHAEVREV